MAAPFLKAAARSLEDTLQTAEEIRRELQICMFVAGAASLEQLKKTPLLYTGASGT
jgi:isopentenyl diphosphate isomerase/L-lactate dehydrogenase-like FMN-dependent dehydrogenase